MLKLAQEEWQMPGKWERIELESRTRIIGKYVKAMTHRTQGQTVIGWCPCPSKNEQDLAICWRTYGTVDSRAIYPILHDDRGGEHPAFRQDSLIGPARQFIKKQLRKTNSRQPLVTLNAIK